jgi:anti-anti-sigma factor
MDIQIDTRADGIAIVQLTGKLDLVNTMTVKQQLVQTIKDGHPKLVIDLTNVHFIDSAGLSALVSGLKHARQAQGDLRLAGPGADIRNVLEFTRLDQVLEVYDTVEQAVAVYGD